MTDFSRYFGKACIWGRCNGTRGADGRCNVCGSKRL